MVDSENFDLIESELVALRQQLEEIASMMKVFFFFIAFEFLVLVASILFLTGRGVMFYGEYGYYLPDYDLIC
jgi:hypothetical protein